MKLNKKVVAGAGLGALALVGGTFAYYNQTSSLDNPLFTGHYGSEVVEDFTPPTEEVKPGAQIEKKVGARNTGDYPVLVRIRMDEEWSRNGGDAFIKGTSNAYDIEGNGVFNSLKYLKDDEDGNPLYRAFQADGSGDYEDTDAAGNYWGDVDGDVPTGVDAYQAEKKDHSVVYKDINNEDWIFNPADGYWYYRKVLQPGESTEADLLNSLSIASNIDLGLYNNTEFYCVVNEGDVTTNDDGEKVFPADTVWKTYSVKQSLDATNPENGGNKYIEIKNGTTVDAKIYDDLNGDGVLNIADVAWYEANGNVKKDDLTGKPNKLEDEGKKLFRKDASEMIENMPGYADANYTLKITSQFVQDTADAIETAFGEAAADIVDQVLHNTYGGAIDIPENENAVEEEVQNPEENTENTLNPDIQVVE